MRGINLSFNHMDAYPKLKNIGSESPLHMPDFDQMMNGFEDFNSRLSTISQNELYTRPGPIINKPICVKKSDGKFKFNSNLEPVYDYIEVNQKAWEYLKQWYSYDIEVPIPT